VTESTSEKGQQAEELVATWLQEQGYTTRQRNFRTRRGEIDLVMTHEDTLVFVEVKSLKRSTPQRALQNITPAKQRRLVQAAQAYLARFYSEEEPQVTFLGVGVGKGPDGNLAFASQPLEFW
jgi:putative endonuclease